MNSAEQKELASADYWDRRYSDGKLGEDDADEEEYEWFKTFDKLRPFLLKHLPRPEDAPKILQLGCGKSVRETVT
jgi:hypothetical protein